MSDGTNRKWIVKKRPEGLLRPGDLALVEDAVPVPTDREFVVRVTHLAFEPAQLYWISFDSYRPAIPIGDVVESYAAGEVVSSKNEKFPVGLKVQGSFGWQDYCLLTEDNDVVPLRTDSELKALNVLGLTGLTAYFGMTEIARPQTSDIVVVSGAAGATGSVAGQIAKIRGARVIGIAGGEEKCRWVTEVAGFDACIDYKSQDIGEQLQKLAPDGINIVFENVGGPVLDAALANLAIGARVCLCGGISSYVADENAPAAGIKNYMQLGLRRSTMTGFLVFDFQDRFEEAFTTLKGWLDDGSLVSVEDVQQGLENAPETLNRIFRGQNLGKQLLAL
ncbi:NADP-dependent oxidoreductase [Sphingobium fluviale]|uniref:NADP-dependent oxidoreductase n=1 Tax=Sphingobium fluviale TaxID=2506423 RepID=A0A4Q1KEU4_9SPHN|nr:NADP-dependent oxidoreductase [Sphingobium fluviale]RXR26039.1 NADP-dependent oxidoreductase [Sphingobium fluviale]